MMRYRTKVLLIVGIIVGLWAVPSGAQGPFSAQIQRAFRAYGFPSAGLYLSPADGIAAAPSYSWASNPFDGLYRLSTGVMIWSSNGSPAVSFSSKIGVGNTTGYCVAPSDNAQTATTNNTFDVGYGRLQAGIARIIGCDISAGAALKIGDPGTRPTCDATVRGTFWIDEGATNVADTVAVCAKDVANSYAWRTIY